MEDGPTGHDELWDDPWSRAVPPAGGQRRRPEPNPRVRRAAAPRRDAALGSRDDHLTFEVPDRYTAAAGPPAAKRSPESQRRTRPAPTFQKAPRVGGSRRRVGPTLIALLVALLLVGGAVAAGWWYLTRPTSVALAASPSDAHVTCSGHSGSGALAFAKARPGRYTFTVSRTGFATATVVVNVARGENVTRQAALQPLPHRLSFVTRPKGAAVVVTGPGGVVAHGVTPCSLTAVAGTTTVAISQSGMNTFTQTLFLDAPHTYDVFLDPKGQLVHALGSLPAKGAPKGVVVTPDGREAWATILNGPPSIQIYDLKTMTQIAGIDLGKYGAVEIVFNRAGTFAYVSQMQTAKVFEIDTATRKVTRSFATDSSWTKVVALSPDEKTLYAANWTGNDVSIISLVTGKLVRRVPTAKTPRGLYPTQDGRYLYVAGFTHGEIQRIDLHTYKLTTLFTSGGAMRHLVGDPKRDLLYASDMAKDTVYVLDMKTLKTRVFCHTDHKPNTIALSPDGRVLFISNRGANNPKSYYIPGYEWGSILLMDTATGKPLDAIVGGNQCTALGVSDDGHTLVFSDFLDNRLRVYSVPDYSVLVAGHGGFYSRHFALLQKKRP